MAKTTRRTIGSVVKSKPDETGKAGPDYIKIREDVLLKKGQILRLESAKAQLESLQKAVAAGKLSPDFGETLKERIEKIPDFVRFEIVSLDSKSEE